MGGQLSVAPNSNLDSASSGVTPDNSDAQTSGLPVPKVARTQRVMFLMSSSASVGASMAFIETMTLRGHDIICCAPQFDDRQIKIFNRLGAETQAIDIPAFSLSSRGLRRAAQQLKETLEELKPDLVLALMQEEGPVAAAMAIRAGAPHVALIVSGLSEVLTASNGLQKWMDWPRRRSMLALYKYALKGSEAVVFHNRDDHKLFKSLRLLPKGLKTTSVNGLGADLSEQNEAPLPALDKGPIFLMAADLADIHGVRDYCDAARLLQTKAPNARCVLVGALPRNGKAMTLKELRQYRGPVHYIGPREDLRPYVERCHVFVAPSRGGGITPGLMMALAAGRPIITTATRGCRYVVAEGMNGLITPAHNPQALAATMAQILRRPDLLPAMASASRARATRYFDSNAINEIVLESVGL
jgi:glycosyltransferase involved in cell wall biosynthesis